MVEIIIFCVSFVVIDTICFAMSPYPERDKWFYQMFPGGGMIGYIFLEKKLESTTLDDTETES